MNNLQKYLCKLSIERFEEIWMHFFSGGCEVCHAKASCDAAPEGTCCRENFTAWAESEEART